jgi:hypothetical protein
MFLRNVGTHLQVYMVSQPKSASWTISVLFLHSNRKRKGAIVTYLKINKIKLNKPPGS